MKKKVLLLGFIVIFMSIYSQDEFFSDDFDYDNMFAEDDMFVTEEEVVSENVDQTFEERRIGFSGDLGINSSINLDRDWILEGENSDNNSINNSISGNLYVDIRLEKGVKAFANIGLDYYPTGKDETFMVEIPEEMKESIPEELKSKLDEPLSVTNKIYTKTSVKELFADYNYNRKIYFRAGKQVLKWGKSYFWNPTDLVNIERKDFFDMDGGREGVFGLKTHIPFGAERNIYLFLNLENVAKYEDLSIAAQYDFMVKDSEMAFSIWGKQDKNPVLGYDISTNIFNTDFKGEISLSYGDNDYRIDEDKLTLYKIEDEIVPEMSVGFTKSFDHNEISERVMVIGEFFYNHHGYSTNIIEKIATSGLSRETQQNLYLQGYEPNNSYKYYGALFGTFNNFLNDSRKTYNINMIGNLVDKSFVVTNEVSFEPMYDLRFNLAHNLFIADENTEYNLIGNNSGMSISGGMFLKF